MNTKQKGTLELLFRPDENAKFKRHILWTQLVKKAMVLFRYATLIGISYIVLSPMISIISKSFFSDSDVYNAMVYVVPEEPTLHNFSLAMERMDYWKTLGWTMLYIGSLTIIQLLVCSLVGYGFARFEFPLKKLFFGCVILTIVIPTYTIMLPLYMHLGILTRCICSAC